jgi:hypothetical protein
MHRPGDYETVRRLLGHRNIQTTIRFYCELTTIHASKEFSKLVRREADNDFDNDESE